MKKRNQKGEDKIGKHEETRKEKRAEEEIRKERKKPRAIDDDAAS